MRRFQAFLIIGTLVLSAAVVNGQLQTNESQHKLQFPHAGVALSVPGDFERRALAEPFDVLRYALVRDDVVRMSVSLSAFPVGEGETPESFAEAKLQELRGHLAMRKFKVLKTAEMPVAGEAGHAIRMSYTFGGIETTAAQLYFIREVSEAPLRICYLLTIEERDKESRLLPVLGEIVRTLKSIPLERPGRLPVPDLGEPITRTELGFAVRPPVGWFANGLPRGVMMGQMDYLLGGIAVPTVQVMVGRAGAGETPEQFVNRHLEVLREDAGSRNVQVEVLSNANATLGGLEGRQFVIRHSAKPTTGGTEEGQAPPAIIVQRTVFADPEDGGEQDASAHRPRSYTLACVYNGDDPDRAVAILESVAEGFMLISEDADQPNPTDAAPAEATTTRPVREN